MDFDEILWDNLKYFKNIDKELGQELQKVEENYKELLKVAQEIELFCGDYDFDENVKGNGYRSFINISHAYISKTKDICMQLRLNREETFFDKAKFKKKLKRFNLAMETSKRIGICLIDNRGNSKTLFNDVGNLDNNLRKIFQSIEMIEGFKAYADLCVSL